MARILIAEDDPRTVEVLQRQLAASGHECTSTRSGLQVLDLIRRFGHNLLVLDVMLPGVSGFELCRRIRRDSELYTLPILILSAMDNDEEVMHGLAQGADDYVAKPFNLNNLMQRIEALLRANADSTGIDALTGLHGSDSSKRELQRRISCGEVFGIAYGEIVGIREFSYRCGEDARTMLIQAFADVLQQSAGTLDAQDIFVGHMGGGHFVTVLPPGCTQAYCVTARDLWKQKLPDLYARIGQSRAYEEALSPRKDAPPLPLLDLLFCTTVAEQAASRTPQQFFETLSQIRAKAMETRKGGVYLDRRTLR